MDGDGKKFSFSFSKTTKKTNITNKPKNESVQLIDCLENNSIKIANSKEVEDSKPLIIAVPASRNISDRIKEFRDKRKLTLDSAKNDDRPDSELTIDELAARELLKESKEHHDNTNKSLILPQNEESLIIDGKEEPTLEDYENVPVSQFGLAALRGMGWKEGMSIGKRQKVTLKEHHEPVLRPKGMGLGVSNLSSRTKGSDKKEDIVIKKGTFIKVTAGSYKNCPCQIQSFDDESGRVIVKTSDDRVISLNEFLVEPISKSEYKNLIKIYNIPN